MSDSTAMAVSAAAMAQASEARQQAHKLQCQLQTMPGFAEAGATVEQRQAYAECVDLIYPQELAGTEWLLVKIAIVLAAISAVAGAWIGGRQGDDRTEMVVYGFYGAVLSAFSVGCLLFASGWAVSGVYRIFTQ